MFVLCYKLDIIYSLIHNNKLLVCSMIPKITTKHENDSEIISQPSHINAYMQLCRTLELSESSYTKNKIANIRFTYKSRRYLNTQPCGLN